MATRWTLLNFGPLLRFLQRMILLECTVVRVIAEYSTVLVGNEDLNSLWREVLVDAHSLCSLILSVDGRMKE